MFKLTIVRMAWSAVMTALAFGMAAALGYFRDRIAAAEFGIVSDLNHFLVASATCAFISGVLGYPFEQVFTREYSSEKQRGNDPSPLQNSSFSSVLLLATLSVVLTLGCVTVASCGLLSAAYSPSILLVLVTGLPAVFFVLFSQSILNSDRRSVAVGLISCILPISTACGIVFIPGSPSFKLATGLVVGQVLQLLIMTLVIKKVGLMTSLRYEKPWIASRTRLRTAYLWSAAGVVLYSSIDFLTQLIAVSGNDANGAAFYFGSKLPLIAANIGVTAIGGIVLPTISQYTIEHGRERARTLAFALSALLFLTLSALVAPALFMSEQIISLAFQRGAFTAAQVPAVSDIMEITLPIIPIMAATVPFARFLLVDRRERMLVILIGCSFLAGALYHAVSDNQHLGMRAAYGLLVAHTTFLVVSALACRVAPREGASAAP